MTVEQDNKVRRTEEYTDSALNNVTLTVLIARVK